jgi:hypothetical protein
MTTWRGLFVVEVADDVRGWLNSLIFLVGVVAVPMTGRILPGQDDHGPPAVCRGRPLREGRAGCAEASLVTVEADQVRVESRLFEGRIDCPDCRQGLRPWGWARRRGVRGIAGALRPRRARCPGCLVTHVLLPVTVLVRRAYTAEVIGAALLARADGQGHRRIGDRFDVPAATVRGWLRVMAARLEPVRSHLLQVARRAGVDLRVPKATGSPWRDLLAALGAAVAAVTGRFGALGVLGPVTAWQVAVACSGGRLLAPGWPAAGRGVVGNTSCL